MQSKTAEESMVAPVFDETSLYTAIYIAMRFVACKVKMVTNHFTTEYDVGTDTECMRHFRGEKNWSRSRMIRVVSCQQLLTESKRRRWYFGTVLQIAIGDVLGAVVLLPAQGPS